MLPAGSAYANSFKKEFLSCDEYHQVIHRLNDPEVGIASLANRPARFDMYASYPWILRFLADANLTRHVVPIDAAIKRLFRYQLPDGQFTLRYHSRQKIPVAAVCHTAHLAYSLVILGYANTPAVRAAYRYILSTRRPDGGWHCDSNKQRGERYEHALSCPAATIHVLHALAAVDDIPGEYVHEAAKLVISHWISPDETASVCNPAIHQRFVKMRYPSHYWGYDLLHVADTLSMTAPQILVSSRGQGIMRQLLNKCAADDLIRSEKTIPEWKVFDFARNKAQSVWITAMLVVILHRYLTAVPFLEETC